jgi:hypothetical protein
MTDRNRPGSRDRADQRALENLILQKRYEAAHQEAIRIKDQREKRAAEFAEKQGRAR